MKRQPAIIGNQKGFTLVEVVAVLVILGMLSAVAVQRYFQLEEIAREKILERATSDLNSQVILSFATNMIEGGPLGEYRKYNTGADPTRPLGPDFVVTGQAEDAPGPGTIHMENYPFQVHQLIWRDPAVDPDLDFGEEPGLFVLGPLI